MKRKLVDRQRSAGERRSAKSPKIQHELRPILSCSSSSSASSAHSRQQRMPHKWTYEQEIAYFDEAQAVFQGDQKPKTKVELHTQIAKRLSTRFQLVFTMRMVKEKYYSYRDMWNSQSPDGVRTLVTTRGKQPITGHEDTCKALFADDAATSSGPLSVDSWPAASHPLNGVDTVTGSGPSCCGGALISSKLPPEVEAAVKYLTNGNGENFSSGKELLIFTEMLCNVKFLVHNFHLMPDDYVLRRNSLIDVFQHGGEGVPKVPEHELPVDFRKEPSKE